MHSKSLEQLSKVFIDIENDIGTTKMTKLSLDSICNGTKNIEYNSLEDFLNKIELFIKDINDSKPRIAIIIYYISLLGKLITDNKHSFKTVEDVIKFIEEKVIYLKQEIDSDSKKIISKGSELIKHGDTILLHDHSSMTLGVILEAKNKGIQFNVILSEQKREITDKVIIFLQENNIPFKVVPEFMLSHIEDEVTLVFIGCVTLNKDFDFVVSPGTNSIVSEFFQAKKNIVVFLSTKKFSLWISETKADKTGNIEEKRNSDDNRILSYTRVKFSHDRASIDMFNNIVTEDGIFTSSEIKKIYNQIFTKNNI